MTSNWEIKWSHWITWFRCHFFVCFHGPFKTQVFIEFQCIEPGERELRHNKIIFPQKNAGEFVGGCINCRKQRDKGLFVAGGMYQDDALIVRIVANKAMKMLEIDCFFNAGLEFIGRYSLRIPMTHQALFKRIFRVPTKSLRPRDSGFPFQPRPYSYHRNFTTLSGLCFSWSTNDELKWAMNNWRWGVEHQPAKDSHNTIPGRHWGVKKIPSST